MNIKGILATTLVVGTVLTGCTEKVVVPTNPPITNSMNNVFDPDGYNADGGVIGNAAFDENTNYDYKYNYDNNIVDNNESLSERILDNGYNGDYSITTPNGRIYDTNITTDDTLTGDVVTYPNNSLVK